MGRNGIRLVIVTVLVAATPGRAQVDPPLITPVPPYIDRGVREITVLPGSAAGLFDIAVDWDFEGFELPFLAGETRNLSTNIDFKVNGQTQGSFQEAAFILPDSGHFCDLTPCQGQVCGQASDGFSTRGMICRESISCIDFPSACDCRCGDTVTTMLATDMPLADGDVIQVTLSRAPGGFSEFVTENDTRELVHRARRAGADFDDDLMHTLADWTALAACMAGPSAPIVSAPCHEGDIDGNARIDLFDIYLFQRAFTSVVEPCIPTSPRLCWPFPGRLAREWIVTRYVDLDPTLFGYLDHTGNSGPLARTYDGHRGTDIEAPTFRAMDADVPVLAAAPGWVEFVRDSEFDRQTTCTGLWNLITVIHANGFRSLYGHIKEDSAVVQTGDFVVPGQKLAVVGSSGCSSAAQLHFELRNCDNEVVDPFLAGMWYAMPAYDAPLGLMDATLVIGPAPTLAAIKDPPANITSIMPGQMLGYGLSLAGGGPGDAATVTLRQPNGNVFHTSTFPFAQVYQHSYWSDSRLIPNIVGMWSVEVRTNGLLAKSYPLSVGP